MKPIEIISTDMIHSFLSQPSEDRYHVLANSMQGELSLAVRQNVTATET